MILQEVSVDGGQRGAGSVHGVATTAFGDDLARRAPAHHPNPEELVLLRAEVDGCASRHLAPERAIEKISPRSRRTQERTSIEPFALLPPRLEVLVNDELMPAHGVFWQPVMMKHRQLPPVARCKTVSTDARGLPVVHADLDVPVRFLGFAEDIDV
jgi:hypothetical protein